MGKMSRTKGHTYERWIAKALRSLFPDARRGYQSRGGGREQADVVGIPGFHIECKALARVRNGEIWNALRQAESDAAPGNYPVAMMKQNRSKTIVCMSLPTFCDLLEEMKGHWEK